MIITFKCKETQQIWNRVPPRKLKLDDRLIVKAYDKLRLLNSAESVYDFYDPPSNRFEALKGDRSGQYSIRINDRWRICFRFENSNAYDVEIVDYH